MILGPATILKAIFHLSPLVPLALGYPFGTAAAVLAVALPYIKLKKLEEQKRALVQRQVDEQDPLLVDLERTISRWRALTFEKLQF